MTPRDLMRATLNKLEQLLMFQGPLEDYLLLAVTKVSAFAIGLGVGWYLWGAV